jgi:NodT family efflux transporter outer membrane factor (OMF) lipoprotein
MRLDKAREAGVPTGRGVLPKLMTRRLPAFVRSVPAHSCRRLPLLALWAVLGGCAAGIEPAESGIRIPGAFRMASATPPAPTPIAWPSPQWWQGFGSRELDELMARAMTANLDLAAANARLRQADALVRLAGSALLPTLDADASAGRARSGSSNLGSAGRGRNSFDGALSASYEVDFWGRNRAALQAAQSSATAARYAVGVTALSTQAAVANTYFAAIGAQELLAIQRGNLEVAERNLGILRQRFAVGTATGLDVAQQESVVAQQRAAIPPLQQNWEANSFALATLAGLPPGGIILSGTALDGLTVPAIAAGLPAEVLARRPDVQAAEADLQAASADVAVARAALLPSIGLTGSGGVRSAVLAELLRPGSTFYSLAAGLVAPIFDGGARRAQLDQTSARREEVLAAYQRAILAALQDTETSLSALQRQEELVALRQAQVAAAQRAYDIAEAQFRAGTVDLLTVLNTQATLFNARNALAQARIGRLQAAASLFTALGGGWTGAEAPGPARIAP